MFVNSLKISLFCRKAFEMFLDKEEPVCCYFDNLLKFSDEVLHFVSTRKYHHHENFSISLNGYLTDEEVISNRKLLASKFGIDIKNLVFARQIHGNVVEHISSMEKGRGVVETLESCLGSDGMMTQDRGICLVIKTADCVPLLFFDPVKKVIAAAHAGWKGTLMKIGARVIEEFQNIYLSKPEDIFVGIGPSIGPCCYEIGNDVASKVKEVFSDTEGILLKTSHFSRYVFDLWEANRRILIEKGVQPQNIELSGFCTRCHSHLFFSARAGDKGRMGSFIMLR
ncbi:MAG TPA: peptidoglycan editing factor PgeF [Bacteroidales bacterium]|jgi:YfiH family protein|nr:peptidoglycan editing factor PgeF [Bacteroidales bacterium]